MDLSSENHFVNHIIDGPFHLTTSGLCGGMSYAVLDNLAYGPEIPSQTHLPVAGSVLHTYLFNRQMRSLENTSLLFLERLLAKWHSREFFEQGLREEAQLGKLRSNLDAGRPIPLGLVTLGINPVDCHQVVAIGYSHDTSSNDLKIYLYDPNNLQEMVLYPAIDEGFFIEQSRKSYESDTVRPDFLKLRFWLTYFVDEAYRERRPPKWDIAVGINWSGQDHSGKYYNGKDLRKSLLVKTRFVNTHLSQVDMTGADARYAVFMNADLKHSDLSNTRLSFADFTNADMRFATLINANARSAIFTRAKVGAIQGKNGNFEHANFAGADINRSRFEAARMKYVIMTGTQLPESDFSKAQLDKANLSQSHLNGCTFKDASLVDANLSHSHLESTDFTSADITDADFSFSHLDGADFSGVTKYDGANFYGASINNVKVEPVLLNYMLKSKATQEITITQVKPYQIS